MQEADLDRKYGQVLRLERYADRASNAWEGYLNGNNALPFNVACKARDFAKKVRALYRRHVALLNAMEASLNLTAGL